MFQIPILPGLLLLYPFFFIRLCGCVPVCFCSLAFPLHENVAADPIIHKTIFYSLPFLFLLLTFLHTYVFLLERAKWHADYLSHSLQPATAKKTDSTYTFYRYIISILYNCVCIALLIKIQYVIIIGSWKNVCIMGYILNEYIIILEICRVGIVFPWREDFL